MHGSDLFSCLIVVLVLFVLLVLLVLLVLFVLVVLRVLLVLPVLLVLLVLLVVHVLLVLLSAVLPHPALLPMLCFCSRVQVLLVRLIESCCQCQKLKTCIHPLLSLLLSSPSSFIFGPLPSAPLASVRLCVSRLLPYHNAVFAPRNRTRTVCRNWHGDP